VNNIEFRPEAVQLADILEANPGAHIEIDNDGWDVLAGENGERITSSRELKWQTEWYDDSDIMDAGPAEALIVLLRRKGIDITAGSC